MPGYGHCPYGHFPYGKGCGTGGAAVIYNIEFDYDATFETRLQDKASIYIIEDDERASISEIEIRALADIYQITIDFGEAPAPSVGGYGIGLYGNFPYGT